MNLSAPFIQRPVMTTLLMVAVLLGGLHFVQPFADQQFAKCDLSHYYSQCLLSWDDPGNDGPFGGIALRKTVYGYSWS